MSDLSEKDISHEMWREYDFGGRVYRIEKPKTLLFRPGGTTHRVIDGDGIAHCVPIPGAFGCVLRWQNAPGDAPCRF